MVISGDPLQEANAGRAVRTTEEVACDCWSKRARDLEDRAMLNTKPKTEATLDLCILSTVSTPYTTPRRVCEPGAVANLQILASMATKRAWVTRSRRLGVIARAAGQLFFALPVSVCFWW